MNWTGFLGVMLFVLVLLVYIIFLRKKENLTRTLRFSFLRITMPKKDSDLDAKKETTHDFKETISIMEQLLTSLKSIQTDDLKTKLLGQDHFSLEYVAHKGEILFYVVCPKEYKNLFEKQINGFYTDAIIEETPEVNIFSKKRFYAGAYLSPLKKYFYPIKTYKNLESDPINALTNAFSKFSLDESGAIQILLKPIDDTWQEKASHKSNELSGGKTSSFSWNPLMWMISLGKMIFIESNDQEESSPKASQQDQEKAKLIDEKTSKTGYEIIARIITTGNNQHIVNSNLTNIASSFRQFNAPNSNGYKLYTKQDINTFAQQYIFRLFNKPWGVISSILNTEEIASLYHFPHIKYNQTPEIKWQNFKIVKAPANIPDEGLVIGDNIYRGVKKEIKIKDEDRFRHFYVIGQTGTGKSSIIQVMARQDLVNGKGIAVIDPHGDLAKDLIPFIPRERADDVIVFNPADQERPMGLNLLEAHNPEDRDLVANDALNIMIKLFGNEIFGPRIQDYFRNGVLGLMEYPEGGAITDIVRMFTDETFQQERVRHIKNPIVKAWWTNTYAAMGEREKSEMIPYFAAKFGQFITNTMMRNIIGQVKSSFDISEVMNTSKILLVNLSKGILGDINSELLGLILVSKIQMAAMRRQNLKKEERRDFFMYIDEFQNYITPSIESILSEARKYRLGLILAHQYLGQLEKSDALTKSNLNLKGAIFGNVGTIMSYKIGPEDGEFMEKYYAPVFSNQDLVNMDKFKAVMKLSVDNQPTTPFSIIPKNPYLESGDEKLAQAFIELSRLKYGRDRMFVQKEIEYRIGVM